MAETEGVIKFNLTFRSEKLEGVDVAELSAWRTVLKDLGLLGQTPGRYDGYGFGNISERCAEGFVISGTQTGELDAVTLDDYAVCESWDLMRNAVAAKGTVKPSSESLSHASIYDVHESVTCALHSHSPEIWQNSVPLGIAVTDESVAYGTPEMAKEVRRLITGMESPGIFSMGGHEDGVFTFGRSLEEAGQLMVQELVRARAFI
jgi:L-ribulose-5-phosphate 4-epimerase